MRIPREPSASGQDSAFAMGVLTADDLHTDMNEPDKLTHKRGGYGRINSKRAAWTKPLRAGAFYFP